MLDVSNKDDYEWVTKFTPELPVTNTPPPSNPASSPTNLRVIIGGTICGIVVIAVVSIFLLYRRYNSRNKAIPTPGDIKM
jgi:hypothetical protein